MKVTRNVICKACNGQFSFFLFLTTAHTKMNQIEVNLIERTLFFVDMDLHFLSQSQEREQKMELLLRSVQHVEEQE